MAMKKMIVLAFGVLLVFPFTSYAQKDVLDEISLALKGGASKEMVKYFNNSVDLTFENDTQTYSKAQSEFVLKDFFKKNPPSNFMIEHYGASKGGQPYAIGQYKSGNKQFRVWIRLKESAGSYKVHEMSIDEE